MKKVLSFVMALAMVICICSASFVFAASSSGATQQPGDIEVDIGGADVGSEKKPLALTANAAIRVSAGETYYIVINNNDGKLLTIAGISGFAVNRVEDTQGEYTDMVDGDAVVYAITNKTGARQKYTITLQTLYTVKFATPDGISKIQDMTCGAAGITLPSVDAPKGYTFVGWAAQSVEDTYVAPQTYAAGASYIATKDVTLAAVYSYTVPGLNETYYTTENFCEHQWDTGVADEKKCTYTCGSCGSTKVKFLGVPGNCNGDTEVNNEDVIYLLWHTLFPETYSMEAYADFTRDGQVNNEDVIYLLWHTLFPESYPLV